MAIKSRGTLDWSLNFNTVEARNRALNASNQVFIVPLHAPHRVVWMLSQNLGERVELTGSMVSKTAESDHDRQTPPHLASRVFPASILSSSGQPCPSGPKAFQKGGAQ